MEMSPVSVFALLPWSLCLLFFLTAARPQTTSSAPTHAASPRANTTLLYESGAATSRSLRNCSCSAPVRDCDEVLANSLCRCHSVPRSVLPPAGLREAGLLAVWVKELWVLEELLNGSTVGHLRLSFCGIKPVDSRYLALQGLQTLGIHSAVPQAPYPDQEMTLSPPAGVTAELDTLSFGSSFFLHVTFVDVALLNGLSVLKAYSVAGPSAPTLSQHFPLLRVSLPPSDDPAEMAADHLQDLLVTFVY